MIQSLIIHLSSIFGIPCRRKLLHMQPSLPIKADLTTCWKSQLGEAILQEFDGREGYIYQLEIQAVATVALPIEVRLADLHILYPLTISSAIQLVAPPESVCYTLRPGRARFFYLPPQEYILHIPAGRTTLFGFYFQHKLFRDNNERPFQFLHPLIEACRQGARHSHASIDFRIGDVTRNYIEHLIQNVRKGDLDSEKYIIDTLIALIQLSRRKIFDEYEQPLTPTQILTRCRLRIAQHIAENARPVVLKHIATQLRVSLEYLGRLHQKHYGYTLSYYRDELLLAKVKEFLKQPYNLLAISEQCGFSDDNALIRFFKKKTGTTPDKYRNNWK